LALYLDCTRISHLCRAVIVAGHAVLLNPRDPLSDASWILLDFQRGEPPCYVGHVRAGVDLAAADPESLLLFSGGQSRREAGPRSEGLSYFEIAEHYGWWSATEVAERAATEEFARDSFENLLFGICRFQEITGRYPDHVTFVSWAFKEQRFGMHREALGWPAARFTYVGANNPPELAQALTAEERARVKYAADPYSSGPEFTRKRDDRNPFRRQHGYFTSCPELAALFHHRGPEPFTAPLPW
jgi:hypothetical protein